MTSKLSPRQVEAIDRIAGLILVNAMMFQEVLAQSDERVKQLEAFRHDPDFISSLADHWKFILEEINYYPIFHIAHELLCCITSDVSAIRALKGLAQRAKLIVGWRAPLRHDLAGRIYHQLLAEAKYLGAYYTSIPASVLLAKVALNPADWEVDWSDLGKVGRLRVADLACGTGTLLMAAADAMVENHIRDSAGAKKLPQLTKVHRLIVEKVLYGFDVLHSAIHLTASTLALRVPDVPINVTNLATLPHAGAHDELGSLEFLSTSTIDASGLFTQPPSRLAGKKDGSPHVASLPPLDLCIMNPPFTSSRQPNLLFGSVPAKDRERMQKKLKRLVKELNLPASITAGLGSVFVALGDQYLKAGGRLALVLPRSLLSGVSWGKTRKMIADKYRLEYAIVSHEPHHWNFSENTSLSEVLVVARKLGGSQQNKTGNVICVNLWKNPRKIEGLTLAHSLMKISASKLPTLERSGGAHSLFVGDRKFGEVVAVPWNELKNELWSFPCSFAQSELVRTSYGLRRGRMRLPGEKSAHVIPVCPLGKLGELGPDPRDVYDAFDLATYKTAYPALWGHDPMHVQNMTPKANAFLEPLSKPREGRKLRKSEDIWPKSACTLITMRTRLNTKRLAAVRLSMKVLSDVWWPFMMHGKKPTTVDAEKALVLWLNSTVGFLILLAHREETEGAWVQFKKPVLQSMPVLDTRELGARSLRKLSAAFDDLSEKGLWAFPELADDPIRAKIDDAVASALGLPDFSIIRQLLSREPILSQTMSGLALPEGQQTLS